MSPMIRARQRVHVLVVEDDRGTTPRLPTVHRKSHRSIRTRSRRRRAERDDPTWDWAPPPPSREVHRSDAEDRLLAKRCNPGLMSARRPEPTWRRAAILRLGCRHRG